MAVPVNRKEFKERCLRRLGDGAVKINVTEKQIDDAVDHALSTWHDYHFDGMQKVYYKFNFDDTNRPMTLAEIEILDGGKYYSNTDTVVITGSGSNAAATITTDTNGTITAVNISAHGTGFMTDPTITVTSNTGSGAVLAGYAGGYIPVPKNFVGAINIFDIGDALMSNNLFNIRYQIALNDLYTLTSVSMIPYFMAMQHIELLEYLLVGKQPIRYNRHNNKLYVDMNWNRFTGTRLLIIEAYQKLDPDSNPDAWGDRWLMDYCTALIKRYWGNNTKKYDGMSMPGGIKFNGQKMYDEAVAEISELEKRMVIDYSLPPMDMIG